MSEKKRMRLEFETQRVDFLKQLNDEFLLVKIYAMAIGKNRNFTYISKEDTEKAIPSAYYCPVVGHIRVYVDADGVEHEYMGGHDFEITDDWDLKVVTRPYGVIVEGSEGWETVNEHGTDVEYLTFNAILWNGRYPELKDAFYSDEILFGQSMEINIENYRPLEEDSNYWEVLGYTFSAFCLLGKADEKSTNGHTDKAEEHTEPAFINAKVVPYEFGLDEFKREFSLLKDKISEFIANATENTDEGGKSMAEENMNVETAVTEDFEDTSAETEVIVDESSDEGTEIETEATDDGDGEAEAVEEDETEPPIESPDYESMYNEMKTAYEGVVAEFEAYKTNHTYSNDEYQILVDYKASVESAERENAETELFSSFADRIGTTDEYAELKENASQYSLDELKMRLFAIVGMQVATTKTQEKTPTSLKFSFGGYEDDTAEKEDPYGNAREYFS